MVVQHSIGGMFDVDAILSDPEARRGDIAGTSQDELPKVTHTRLVASDQHGTTGGGIGTAFCLTADGRRSLNLCL